MVTELTLVSIVISVGLFVFKWCCCIETRATREQLESKLNCGVPKTFEEIHEDEEVRERRGGRVKRVVGGLPTAPVSPSV